MLTVAVIGVWENFVGLELDGVFVDLPLLDNLLALLTDLFLNNEIDRVFFTPSFFAAAAAAFGAMAVAAAVTVESR